MIAIICLVLLILILITISLLFMRTALDGKAKGADTTAELSPTEFAFNREERVRWLNENTVSWRVKRYDGLSLHAYFAKGDSHKYIITAHGYRGSSDFNVSHVKPFVDMGWNALIIDQRAHGLSGGRYISMGWNESRDIVSWVDEIVRTDSEAEIVLHGISMGGATVLMAAGLPLCDNVKAVVEDCGYTSVWDIFALQLKTLYHLPAFPILYVTSFLCKLRFGFSFKEVSALESVQKTKLPILFIHGDADTFVPFSYMEKLYQAAPSPKEKLIVEGARHAFAQKVNPSLYFQVMNDFLRSYV